MLVLICEVIPGMYDLEFINIICFVIGQNKKVGPNHNGVVKAVGHKLGEHDWVLGR